MNNKPNFSLDDFKKWMRNHNEDESAQTHAEPKQSSLIGTVVESKIDEDRIQAKMKNPDGHPEDLSLEFFENGGVISDVDGKHFLIEVDSGSFLIHRAFVRRS